MALRTAGNCPVASTLSVVGEKWSLHIVRDLLLDGPRRFQDFLDSFEVTPNTLSARLKSLEHHGVIDREVYSEHPPRARYVLTRKGYALGPVIGAMRDWGRSHTDVTG